MQIGIYTDSVALGREAARVGATGIRQALADNGEARIILATGASQMAMIESLVKEPGIDWSKVDAFHLDEYVNLPETHKASFRKYLKERVVNLLPSLRSFTFVEGDAPNTAAEIKRLNKLVSAKDVDVAFIGIGENGHLAFNDPPADTTTESPYIVVELDDACKKQQVGEGWFPTINDVPPTAISMSIRHILKSRLIVCTVPDGRKAPAVKMAVKAPIGPMAPCAYLRTHNNCYLLVDRPAAGEILTIAE